MSPISLGPAAPVQESPAKIFAMSNVCMPLISPSIKRKKVVGEIAGNVMEVNCRHRPAPSIFAASYKLGFTPVSAAIYSTMPYPGACHTMVMISIGVNAFGSFIQFTPFSLPSILSTVLIMP